jgi:hypothetical protein
MKTGRAVVAFVILIVVVAVFLGMTGRVIHAQDSGASDPTVMTKLDAVIGNQKLIMESLVAIKEELGVIKVRVSQNQ